jgi:non-specific serine/threonine protein kinase
VLGEGAARAPDVTVTHTDELLTRRELEVSGLVAQGLSNKQLAKRLLITVRTAETHVNHVLGKLGFTSRSQIAAWYMERRQRG